MRSFREDFINVYAKLSENASSPLRLEMSPSLFAALAEGGALAGEVATAKYLGLSIDIQDAWQGLQYRLCREEDNGN
ncbi:MAG: hypothetical protein RSB65_08090 [Oscillospiraceae bacterium]